MELYHGSNCVIEEPKIIFSDKKKDFGDAFYLTRFKWQAEKRAKDVVRYSEEYSEPIVNVYGFSYNDALERFRSKIFLYEDEEWITTILKYRYNNDYDPYDIIEGPMIDSRSQERVFRELLNNIIDPEEAISKLRFNYKTNQIALKEIVLPELHFKRFERVPNYGKRH